MFKIKTEKLIFFTTIIILLITIIPLLNYSNYIHPYTDEYAFSAIPHNVWKNSGSILEVIKASAKQTITNYYSWQGSFSAVFLFGLNPLSFSYESYKIVGYFLILSFTFSFLFFMFNLLNKVFNIEKITSASVANIVIILITATLPEIGEHFYYYISGIYYNFFISLAFIAFGFLIIFLTNNQKQFFIYKILIIFLFAFISGGNYPVVLISLCILTLIFISCIINNRKETYLVISLSLLLLLIGFIISIIAPGNSARQELQLNSPMNPFLAIIKSIIYCAYLWLKYLPLIILPLIFIVLIIYNKINYSHYKLHPIFILILSFLLNASIFTPTYYALGNPGPLRILNIAYIIYIIFTIFNLIYFIKYFENIVHIKKIGIIKNKLHVKNILFLLLIFYLIFTIKHTSTYKAISSTIDKTAYYYSLEKYKRHNILSNANKNAIIELEPISIKPNLLEYGDITNNTNSWINKSFCDYYNIYKVKLIE